MARAWAPVLLSFLAACATQPERTTPVAAVQPGALAAAQSLAAPASAWPSEQWWTQYGDPQLDALITEGLKASPSLAQAAARLRAAEALWSAERASLLPSLAAKAGASVQKQSYNAGVPADFVTRGYQDYGRATLDFSQDLDFWGRNRAAIAAAASEAKAAQADAAAARLMLSAAIADAYAELSRLYAERDIAQQALSVREQTARLAARRVDAGLDTQGELRLAEAGPPSARARIAALDESLALARNGLAALLGAGPDRGLRIERPAAAAPAAFALPDNLSADLIGRRPDIVAARWRAEAASRRVKQSQAAFYPNVNLTAFIGLDSLGLDNLLKSGSDIASVAPAISLPIFQGGRLRANLSRADAERDAAIAAYNSALVDALRQVADAAASKRALELRLLESRAALAANEDAYRIARQRYQGGLSNYQAVLLAEDAVLQQRLTVAALESRAFSLDVALTRALGGGFTEASG